MLGDFLHQTGELAVIQCGNRYNRRKFIQLAVAFHNLEQLLLICQLVNFIYYQNYRCFYLLQQVQDIIFACAAFFGCIHYKEDNVNLLQGAFSRAHHIFAQLVLRLVDARCIKKHNLRIIRIHNAHNLVAGCLRSVGHNSDFLTNQTICQS